MKKNITPNDVTILIPTKNEEKGIGWVIDGFKRQGYTNILVIDGNSSDRTRDIAKEKGAKVVIQNGKGKGQAIAEAFKIIDSEVVVIIDGDGTYDPNDVKKLLKPIERGVADHVIGNRLSNFEKGAFTRLNLIGNKIFNWLFRFLYGVDVYDILTGYRALSRELYKSVELEKHGFETEAELTVETIAKGFQLIEVPITYRKRMGKANLHPIKDGWRIGKTIMELLVRYNPAKYLYLLGGIFLILGPISGVYVVYEWFTHISHDLLAIVTAILILGGVQFVAIGFVMTYMFKMMTEIKKELRMLKR